MMQHAQPTIKESRVYALDVLRGIAALIVVFSHLLLTVPEEARYNMPIWLRLSPLRVFTNGHYSVILFFVLSGYVLSFSFVNKDRASYAAYAVKRLCRIYVPFFVAILVAALLFVLSSPVMDVMASGYLRGEWRLVPLTSDLVINHLIMRGSDETMWLNGVMWSLIVELRISLVFPLVLILCRRLDLAVLTAAAIYIAATIAIILNHWTFDYADNMIGSLVVTARYIPLFMLGILLAQRDKQVQQWLGRQPAGVVISLLLFAIGVLYLPTEVTNSGNVPFIGGGLSDQQIHLAMKWCMYLLQGASSALFIIYVRCWEEKLKLFRLPAMRWLGAISYSLYLIHVPILFFLFRHFYGSLAFGWICCLVVATSLIAASLFHLVVEQPSMRLGKYLSARIDRRRAA